MPTYYEMAARCDTGETISWNVTDEPDFEGDLAPRQVQLGTIVVARSWMEREETDNVRANRLAGALEDMDRMDALYFGAVGRESLIIGSDLHTPLVQVPVVGFSRLAQLELLQPLPPPPMDVIQVINDTRLSRFVASQETTTRIFQVPINLANLKDTRWQIQERWVPLTEQKAREGMLRLLNRRLVTQPLAWYERIDEDQLGV